MATTHASWVFLTDREAWKVKRPVNLGFLDFSTTERRRLSCEDEVRLGRRLAADVYLGVAAVYSGPKGASFVEGGPVMDYAVRMRRLPDADSAAGQLASGELTCMHLHALAQRLADFYALAPVTPDLGGPERLAALVEENAAETQPFMPTPLDPALVKDVLAWQREQVVRHADRIRARTQQRRVRDGHGDLRLEHVYFEGGEPQRSLVIDPIEFNRVFRCGDVGLDVAFLAMELEAASRSDLASYFLSSFAHASQDYGWYPLIDFFLSYRAWVRAKVACIAGFDADAALARRHAKLEEARRLMSLAARFTTPAGARSLIAIGGTIGTGKSTLADRLAQTVPAAVVSSDPTRKHLAGLPARERGNPEIYTPEFTRATYDEVLRCAQDVLASGRSVIVDATFPDQSTRAAVRELAAQLGASFTFVELDADDDTLRARLLARARAPHDSDATADLLTRMHAQWTPATELPTGERLKLDARQDIAVLVERVRRRLS